MRCMHLCPLRLMLARMFFHNSSLCISQHFTSPAVFANDSCITDRPTIPCYLMPLLGTLLGTEQALQGGWGGGGPPSKSFFLMRPWGRPKPQQANEGAPFSGALRHPLRGVDTVPVCMWCPTCPCCPSNQTMSFAPTPPHPTPHTQQLPNGSLQSPLHALLKQKIHTPPPPTHTPA